MKYLFFHLNPLYSPQSTLTEEEKEAVRGFRENNEVRL